MKLKNQLIPTVLMTAIFFIVVTVSWQLAAAQGTRPGHDPLAGLSRALQEANATPLSTDQATQLKALITNFQQAHPRPQGPNPAVQAARKAYEDAILAGNASAAAAAQAQLASLMAAAQATRAQAQINFEIAALGILNGGSGVTGAQVAALIQKFGEGRVVEMIGALAHGGFGPGFGGPRGGFGTGFGGPREGFAPGKK